MTPLAQAISGALLQFVWQGFLVSLFASAAAFLLRKQQPNIRYLVYCVAMISLAALPILTAIAIYDPLADGGAARHPAVTLTIRAVWNGSGAYPEKWLAASQIWMLRMWILGVVFLSLRLSWLTTRVASLRRSGDPADERIMAFAAAVARRMGTTRAIRVMISAIPDGPSVVGWCRPVILLPAATILNLTPDQLEAILAHEVAHLRRYDDVVNIVQSVIETLLFYHPAVWWVSNRIRHERELCCDDLAVRASAEEPSGALCYARALAALEALRVNPPRLTLGALGALGNASSPLEYRIRRIVGAPAPQDYLPSAVPGVLAFGLTLASMAIYSIPAHGSAPSPPQHARAAYPESARADGVQGTVPVEVKIDGAGHVSGAKAMGGPRELRRAAVESASALQFAPATAGGTEQVNVAFQLVASVPPVVPVQASVPDIQPLRSYPRWRDNGESAIGLAADTEKDPARQLDLLKQWEQLYPNSEFRAQRAFMTAEALLGVLGATYGKTDPAILDAGKKAAQQLADHFDEYLDDSVKPDTLTPEEWAVIRKTSELQIHTILAYIARTNHDDETAEVELDKVLALDPGQADASFELGSTIIRKIAVAGDVSRYPEALYDLARSLAVTGPSALLPAARNVAESALDKQYTVWHGSEEGIDDLEKQAGESALPPPGFHIEGIAELNGADRRAHTALAAAHPDPDLWESTKTALLEHGDACFANLRDVAMPAAFQAVVVSQVSSGRILVNIDNAPAGDAVLRFDNSSMRTFRPGAVIQFRGVPDSWTREPYTLTFVIRNPKEDIVGLKTGGPGFVTVLARIFRGLAHLVQHVT